MKRLLLSAAVCMSLLTATVSCNDSSKKGNASGTAAEYEDQSSSSANNIIEYTNLIVDLSNKNNDYVNTLMKYVDKAEKGLKNPSDPFAFSGMLTPHSFPTFNRNSKVKVDEPVKDLSKADQQFFKEKVTSYIQTYKQMDSSYKQLKDYLSAQDYKDDKGAKGNALISDIRSHAEALQTEKVVLMKKVSEVADASEIIILKDSPLKTYILAMKEDMKSISDFIAIMEDGAASYGKVADKAQAAYDALEKAQAAHAKIDMDNATKAHKEVSYNSFYDGFHTFLLDARKIMRDAKEKGSMPDYIVEQLSRSYDNQVSRYNTFNR
ncbi:YiiG family protein [Chitinophaga nivalis]|uniref:YiiG family protein n=1 Tax=Chitinophaga nivalis TaxID=2991709 RepID=A0ABT3IGE3_9BACT|nr:YiiG family protein [Chitinophaga nivalis]MCW3467280.1 YiiG family protein [Chitinophaga nivalis]MCW3483028.1 YiiG family protein [Chitinophaga nivalis]